MPLQDTLTRLGNPFIRLILRSPLHGLMSGSVLLLSYRGLKSGRRYSTPVNYQEDEQGALWVISFRRRTWWRNLRGGQEVQLRLRGKEIKAWGEPLEDSAQVSQALMGYLQRGPSLARYLNVQLDANGQPVTEDVARAAHSRVLVRLQPRTR